MTRRFLTVNDGLRGLVFAIHSDGLPVLRKEEIRPVHHRELLGDELTMSLAALQRQYEEHVARTGKPPASAAVTVEAPALTKLEIAIRDLLVRDGAQSALTLHRKLVAAGAMPDDGTIRPGHPALEQIAKLVAGLFKRGELKAMDRG